MFRASQVSIEDAINRGKLLSMCGKKSVLNKVFQVKESAEFTHIRV